jgi:hypothetical protein
MAPLTPQQRAGEVSYEALRDGLISGGLTFIPAYGAVWLAMKRSPKFVQVC